MFEVKKCEVPIKMLQKEAMWIKISLDNLYLFIGTLW